MPSFDVVSELQTFEVKHAVQNTEKEVATRFDFKGSDIKIELNEKDKKVTITIDKDWYSNNINRIQIEAPVDMTNVEKY